MTEEAAARTRLLAHYESKLAMLKEHVMALVAELGTGTGAADRRTCMARISARENEIANVEVDAARLREMIASA